MENLGNAKFFCAEMPRVVPETNGNDGLGLADGRTRATKPLLLPPLNKLCLPSTEFLSYLCTTILLSKSLFAMSQIVLEFSNQDDLMLLLTFAKRLNATVISVKKVDAKVPSSQTAVSQQLALMQQAANDPLFLEDVEEVMADFAYADSEEL